MLATETGGIPSSVVHGAKDSGEGGCVTPQVSAREFERLPLRVHSFLAGVPLHDVWAVNLPRPRGGITLDQFLQAASKRLYTLSPLARMLLEIRFFVGRILRWDRASAASASETFATRLTVADRARSLAPAGTPDGLFRVVYRYENEQLVEISNRTAHAAALSALVETPNAYRFYFGVYVQSVGGFTQFYMALIDPFRKLIVYPSLLRNIRTSWEQTFGKG